MWCDPVTLSDVNDRLDRTQELPTEQLGRGTATEGHAPPDAQGMRFRPGKAAIPAKREPTLAMRPELPTGQIGTSGRLKQPRPSLRTRLRLLRSGGRWSTFGAVVLVVCWSLWAAQSGRDSLTGSGLVLVLIFMIAAGLFGVSRLAGGIILEKVLSRRRRSALLSHMGIGLFLVSAGVSLLLQVSWVVNAWNQAVGIR